MIDPSGRLVLDRSWCVFFLRIVRGVFFFPFPVAMVLVHWPSCLYKLAWLMFFGSLLFYGASLLAHSCLPWFSASVFPRRSCLLGDIPPTCEHVLTVYGVIDRETMVSWEVCLFI